MRRCARALAACALLQGCANLPLGSDGLSQEERRLRLEAVDRWQVRGRLAVDTGERAFQGSFNWQQEQDALTLLDPRTARRRRAANQRHAGDAHRPRARREPCARRIPKPSSRNSSAGGCRSASLSAWLRGLEDEAFPAETRGRRRRHARVARAAAVAARFRQLPTCIRTARAAQNRLGARRPQAARDDRQLHARELARQRLELTARGEHNSRRIQS